MKITILCVGKIKERYFVDAIAEYSKRLGRYVTLQIVEVADEKTPDGASEALEEQIRAKEGERLMKYFNKDAYRIALAIDGKMRDSVDLSKHMEQLGVRGNSHIIFVIGGSLGLSAQVLKECDERLSFSPMTFPHQLMRVILLEQIYRAYRIMNHEPYHK
jgi:23S rRNA (pseudouridine1915-N3)-methyltransferase